MTPPRTWGTPADRTDDGYRETDGVVGPDRLGARELQVTEQPCWVLFMAAPFRVPGSGDALRGRPTNGCRAPISGAAM